MNAGIGEKKTRSDHRYVADQLYALYAQGRDLRRLVAIIGEAALSADDQRVLTFSQNFEQEFIHQGIEDRSISDTLDLAWELLNTMPVRMLKRIPQKYLEKFYNKAERKDRPI